MSVAIIIPARYESTRFPGKPLAEIAGKPMIEWVVNAAKGSKLANRVIVATEDKRILDFVKDNLGVEVFITSKEHKCGTDRITEIVKNNDDIEIAINFQGDEPLMPSDYLDKVISPLLTKDKTLVNNDFQIVTLISPISSQEEINNSNIVKVVMDKNMDALYFSRSTIPHIRDKSQNESYDCYFRHIGIYAYSRESILQFSKLSPSKLETLEQLEQLRALENGFKIRLEVVPKAYPAVDVPGDVKVVEGFLVGAEHCSAPTS